MKIPVRKLLSGSKTRTQIMKRGCERKGEDDRKGSGGREGEGRRKHGDKTCNALDRAVAKKWVCNVKNVGEHTSFWSFSEKE